MLLLGPIGFTAPYVLLGLIVLPVLWWLLRVTPPPPKAIAFPAIRLLRDLVPPEETAADGTPLWLILFRMALVALIVAGLAGPVLHPQAPSGYFQPAADRRRQWLGRGGELAGAAIDAGRGDRPRRSRGPAR